MKQFYPGSKKEIQVFTDVPEEIDEPEFLGEPVVLNYAGSPTEFYKIGALARALNRQPGTIRLWERRGIIPKSLFTIRSANRYAKRRLYMREQIEGLRNIAIEEGILSDTSRHISDTKFAQRAEQLFKELL